MVNIPDPVPKRPPRPVPPTLVPEPVREPDPERLPDEAPIPNPDETPQPPMQADCADRRPDRNLLRLVPFHWPDEPNISEAFHQKRHFPAGPAGKSPGL